jgi:hypothetical protein
MYFTFEFQFEIWDLGGSPGAFLSARRFLKSEYKTPPGVPVRARARLGY